MKQITLKSPAKLNLYLEVLGKRPDGYHDIETIFERISICDEITLKKIKKGIKVACDDRRIPSNQKNLAYKAAKLLKESYAVKGGVSIYIKKKIPVAAGLGGGSSNAAFVLLGLAKLWNLKVKKTDLAQLGKKIGADVPFFIYGKKFALGKGRGDEIIPLRQCKQRIRYGYGGQVALRETDKFWHVILNPNARVSTKDIYREFDKRKVKMVNKNRLFECALRLCPEINKAVRVLKKAGAGKFQMTGSGPTLFTIHHSRGEALKLLVRLRQCKHKLGNGYAGYKVFAAKTI